MAGMISGFFLYSIGQMLVRQKQLACNLVDFHKFVNSPGNHIRNMLIQKLEVVFGNFFASVQNLFVRVPHLAE